MQKAYIQQPILHAASTTPILSIYNNKQAMGKNVDERSRKYALSFRWRSHAASDGGVKSIISNAVFQQLKTPTNYSRYPMISLYWIGQNYRKHCPRF